MNISSKYFSQESDNRKFKILSTNRNLALNIWQKWQRAKPLGRTYPFMNMKKAEQYMYLHKRPLFSCMEVGGKIIYGQDLPQKTILGLVYVWPNEWLTPKLLEKKHGLNKHRLAYLQNRAYQWAAIQWDNHMISANQFQGWEYKNN